MLSVHRDSKKITKEQIAGGGFKRTGLWTIQQQQHSGKIITDNWNSLGRVI